MLKRGMFLFLCILIGLQGVDISFAQQKGRETAPEVAKAPAGENTPGQIEKTDTKKAGTEVAAESEEPEEGQAETPSEPEGPTTDAGNVTVNFKGADIRTVLAYLSEVSGMDIVPAPDVKGVVDLKLTNKPWKAALDIILRNYGFAYEREGDIIRVLTVDKLKQEELTTQTFSLNYSKAKDVAAAIKNIVGERGKVVYDDRTNTVLVTDIPTSIYKIGEIVQRLDKMTDQVLITARVIETVLDDSEKLGIDWNVKFSIAGAKRPTTLPFDQFGKENRYYFPQVQTASPAVTTSTTTTSTVTDTSDFPSKSDGIHAFPFVDKDLFSFGTLDFSEFQAVLEMIKSRSNTDIISNPRIATLNNTEALINVGQTLNLPKYERNSSTGKMEITGYDPKDLGIILKVTPHVNDNGEIVIDLAPEISDLLRYDTLDRASGIVAPVFSTRIAKTQIMIRDGDTIFIGGLIRESDVETKKKLPFIGDLLGDVPYIGLLFTKKDIIKQKTELIFFITVNLMKHGKEIKDIPSSASVRMPSYSVTQTPDLAVKKKKKTRY